MKGMAVDPRAPGLTLGGAFRIFRGESSTRRIVALWVLVAALRLWIGNFTVLDAIVAASLVALHPLTEWIIHVCILHLRPRRVGPWLLDTRAGHDHRLHHADPHDPRYWFIPLSSSLVGLVVISVVARALAPTPGVAVTVMLTATTLALVYEWTHYLCHTSYRPRGRWLRRRQRLHRLHHFKSEHYWFGVTMHAADWVLGTLPDPRTVATSATCRSLLTRGRAGDDVAR